VSNREFDAMLEYLKGIRGFDFTAYKRQGLIRRVQQRMHRLGYEAYGSYLDYLEEHPEEFPRLLDTILVNVTSFFRDMPCWEYLDSDIIPRLLVAKDEGKPIRVWSAGCATGEEAYTLAMLLAEHLGDDAFCQQVKIFATDVNDGALKKARDASYTAAEIAPIPPPLASKYFEPFGDMFVFKKPIRKQITFGRHDLIQEAPIARIDLLVCRNTIMYFTLETQTRALERLHLALKDDGYLFLGMSEMVFTHSHTFTPINVARRIFTRVSPPPPPEQSGPPLPPSRDRSGSKYYAEKLQTSRRELETAYEELQSTNEELEITYQGLQISNEELVKTHEELQKSYRILRAANDKLLERNTDCHREKVLLNDALHSLPTAVAVVNCQGVIEVWNKKAAELWGLRAEDVEHLDFFALDFGLPVEQLQQTMEACWKGDPGRHSLRLASTNGESKRFHCQITCAPIVGTGNEVRGVVLMMTEQTQTQGEPAAMTV
jgi:two-component system CheB/CheR fusion protein